MKKRLLILAALFAGCVCGAFGLDLSTYGFQVTGTHQENNMTAYDAKDANGTAVSVLSAAALTDANAKSLRDLLGTLEGWKYLKIDHLRAKFNSDGSADVVVMPSSFSYKNVELTAYLPSGLQFSYNGSIAYDFRMLKDNLFLRLKGQVFDENQFAERLLSAVKDPILYLQTTDPEYLQRRMDELVAKVDTLSAQIVSLGAQIASLGAQIASLAADHQKSDNSLKVAIVTLNNKGFFGNITPVNSHDVDEIVTLKRADPTPTKDQIAERLKQKAVKVPGNVISLVLGVYFNQF